MFLLVTEETYHHVDGATHNVVGEFETTAEADAAIVAKAEAGEFTEAQDGGGTRFCQVDSGDYIKVDGEIFIRFSVVSLYAGYVTPEKVKRMLEPY